MLLCCRCINLLFKNQCPLILWSHLFPKKYLKPQLSINKMVIENSVQYHPSPSRSTSRIILSYSYRTYTFVSEILTNFSPTIGKLFPTKCMVFRLLEYALLSHKTQKLFLLFTSWKQTFLPIPPTNKNLPPVLIITPTQGEITHSLPCNVILKIYFLPSRKREGRKYVHCYMKKNPGTTNQAFEQREDLLNNTDHSIDSLKTSIIGTCNKCI